jgi:ACS family hexuronate transporter-like MFS transporter
MVTNIVVDRFPEALVGTASGVIASGSGLGGLLSAELIGMTVQGRGYAAVFVALAFLHPIALLLVCRLRRFV